LEKVCTAHSINHIEEAILHIEEHQNSYEEITLRVEEAILHIEELKNRVEESALHVEEP